MLPALAGRCWRGGKGQLLLRQEELAAAGWHRRMLCQRYGAVYDELWIVTATTCGVCPARLGPARGSAAWGRLRPTPTSLTAPSLLPPQFQDGQHQEGTNRSCLRQSCEP